METITTFDEREIERLHSLGVTITPDIPARKKSNRYLFSGNFLGYPVEITLWNDRDIAVDVNNYTALWIRVNNPEFPAFVFRPFTYIIAKDI